MIAIETLRVRIGLADNDTTRDAEILAVSQTAMALMEAYCNRKFPHSLETEVFTHVDATTVSLHRYPVVAINVMNPNADYHLEKQTGLIHFDSHIHVHELTVNYEGGYTQFPADLELAMLMLFDNVWAIQSGGGGGVAGNVESATITGVGTVRFSTGDDSQGSSGLMDGTIMDILDRYRRVYS